MKKILTTILATFLVAGLVYAAETRVQNYQITGLSKDWALNTPAVGDKIKFWKVVSTTTITSIDCLSDDASSTSVNAGIDLFQANSAGVASTSILSGGTLTCISTANTSTTTNVSIPTGNWVGVVVKTASGTPSWLQTSFKFTNSN